MGPSTKWMLAIAIGDTGLNRRLTLAGWAYKDDPQDPSGEDSSLPWDLIVPWGAIKKAGIDLNRFMDEQHSGTPILRCRDLDKEAIMNAWWDQLGEQEQLRQRELLRKRQHRQSRARQVHVQAAFRDQSDPMEVASHPRDDDRTKSKPQKTRVIQP